MPLAVMSPRINPPTPSTKVMLAPLASTGPTKLLPLPSSVMSAGDPPLLALRLVLPLLTMAVPLAWLIAPLVLMIEVLPWVVKLPMTVPPLLSVMLVSPSTATDPPLPWLKSPLTVKLAPLVVVVVPPVW